MSYDHTLGIVPTLISQGRRELILQGHTAQKIIGAVLIAAALVAGGSALASEWESLPAADSYVSLKDLPKPPRRIERRVETNDRYLERALFDGRKGFVFLEYVVDTFYEEGLSYFVTGSRYLRQELEKHYTREKVAYDVGKTGSFQQAQRRGTYMIVSIPTKIRTCFHSASGYKFNTHAWSGEVVYDTLVTLQYCDYEISDEMRGKLVDFITHMSLNK